MTPKTILILEDEPVIRALCRRVFAGSPHRIVAVDSVGTALEAIAREIPDLLITDLRLPDGDGTDAIRALRARSRAAKVIIISGSITPDDRLRQTADLDVMDYLCKPFEIAAFRDAVRRAMGEDV